jgi:hypothetical protein
MTDWDPQEPPDDFVERVVTAAMRERRGARRWRYAIAGVGALAAAAVLVLLLRGGTAPSAGDVAAAQRMEVALGARGVAVLEPGAHVAWRGDVVEQDRGDVFYRVERGATFEVHTPAGTATVLGTCFRIVIDAKESAMNRKVLAAGAVGVAAVVGVIVYEGKVKVASGKDSVTVAAGEQAVADGRGVRAAHVAAPKPTTAHADEPAAAARTAAELRDRLAALEKEKSALEQELAHAYESGGKSPYDLTPEDWAKLASDGSIKYQLPCFREGGFRPTPEQLAHLGLQPGDADAIQAAYQHSNQRFGTAMRQLCGASESSDISACISKLFTSIYASGDAHETFTQVAEIRAGKRPVPKDASPAVGMLLEFTGAMPPFEAELAQRFGAEEAHRIAFSDELCFQANTLQ